MNKYVVSGDYIYNQRKTAAWRLPLKKIDFKQIFNATDEDLKSVDEKIFVKELKTNVSNLKKEPEKVQAKTKK
jgi:hypothetical protein